MTSPSVSEKPSAGSGVVRSSIVAAMTIVSAGVAASAVTPIPTVAKANADAAQRESRSCRLKLMNFPSVLAKLLSDIDRMAGLALQLFIDPNRIRPQAQAFW